MVMGVGGVIGALAPDSPRSLDPPCAADRGLPAGGRLIARNKKRIWLPVQHPSVNKLSLRFATNVWAVQPSIHAAVHCLWASLPALRPTFSRLCQDKRPRVYSRKLSWVQASLSRLTLGCPSPSPTLRLVAPRGHRSKRNGDIAFSLLSEAALCPARWRASSCRPKLGGALRRPHTRRLDHMRAQRHAGPSVDGAGRASTVPVAALACAVRQGRARAPPPAAPP